MISFQKASFLSKVESIIRSAALPETQTEKLVKDLRQEFSKLNVQENPHFQEIRDSTNPSSFGYKWAKSPVKYLCHRPALNFGPHVSIYHEIFEQFLVLKESIKVNEIDSQFTLKLCGEMSEGFDLEEHRSSKFRELFAKYIGKNILDKFFINLLLFPIL